MVGRDLLAGCLFGCGLALVEHVFNALPAWFNLPGQTMRFEVFVLRKDSQG